MSARDQEPAADSISRVEDRERLLAETLAHAEAREEKYRISFTDPPRRGRWKVPAAMAVLAVAALVAAFPPSWVSPGAPRVPSGSELERGRVVALQLQADQVEVFRLRHGRLPESLDELPIRVPGIDFVRSNSRVYQLVVARADGSRLVYDSAHPEPGPGAQAPSWMRGDEP